MCYSLGFLALIHRLGGDSWWHLVMSVRWWVYSGSIWALERVLQKMQSTTLSIMKKKKKPPTASCLCRRRSGKKKTSNANPGGRDACWMQCCVCEIKSIHFNHTLSPVSHGVDGAAAAALLRSWPSVSEKPLHSTTSIKGKGTFHHSFYEMLLCFCREGRRKF